MKVGDLVTLRWGEHPRQVGTIIKGLSPLAAKLRMPGSRLKILWFGAGRTGWITETDLEIVSD